MLMSRRKFTLAVGTLVATNAVGSIAARAESWPQRPVRVLLTLGGGSGTDIGMRLLADRLPRRWNQPVVIENRPGGDGVVAISAFLNANDDHVLLGTPVSSLEASINAQRATVAAAAKSLGIKSLQ
jgi:tripartite-type tricarboxylate transporter receptor subunit TctC